MHIEYLTRHTV